jgi:1-deoxy-D-xylulose-5-phosphate synthase
MVSQAKKAASNLQKKGLGCMVVNARFLKPLDKNLLLEQVKNLGAQGLLVTIEENTVVGGLGAAILECLAENNLTVNILNLGVPDQFVEHGSPAELLAKLGLDPAGIERAIEKRARG